MNEGRLRTLGLVVIGLAVVAWLFLPVGLDPTGRLVGSPCAEAPPHLWGLWTTTQGIFEHGPLLRVSDTGFPGSFRSHLMDPVNLVFFGPGYVLGGGGARGAALGWNGMVLAWVVVGLLGCAALGRRLYGREDVAGTLALAVGFVAASYTLGFPLLGRTEFLPAALAPLHLALLHRYLREARPPPWLLLATLGTLGAAALGGWYLAVFLALLELPLALLFAWGLPPARSARRLTLVAFGASLFLLPAVWALAVAPPTESIGASSGLPPSPFSDMTFSVADMLRLPGREVTLDAEQAAYPGLVLLGLALLGAWAGGRQAWALLATGVGLSVLATGPFLSWDGISPRPDQILLLPAGVLEWVVPMLRPIRSWSRLGVLAALPLALAAGFGARWMWARGRAGQGAVALLLVLCFADQASWPKGWAADIPRSFEVAMPEGMAQLLEELPEGALLQLPLALDQRVGCQVFGPYLLWQLQHGRPVSAVESELRDGSLALSWISRRVGRAQRSKLDGRLAALLGARERACARADRGVLEEAGFAAILFHEDMTSSEVARTWMLDTLGPPDLVRGTVSAWTLQGVEADQPCALPKLPWE